MLNSSDTETTLHAFGKRLRFLRRIENLTQSQLAERAGISFEHVNKLERGACGPSFAVVCALAKALNTEPASLFLFSAVRQGGTSISDAPHPGKGGHNLDWTNYIVHCGNWQWGHNNEAASWSADIYRMLGYKVNEVPPSLSLFISRHVAPEYQSLMRQWVKRQMDNKGSDDLELVFLRKDGERRIGWVHRIMDDEDGSEGIKGVLLDLTELKRIEGFMLQNHAKLEAILKLRTEHRDEMIRVLGEEVQERRKAQEQQRRLVEELEAKNRELEDKTGALERALDAFEHNKARHDGLASAAPIALLALDQSGRIVEGNAAARRLFGLDDSTLERFLLTDLLDMEDRTFANGLADAVRENECVPLEATGKKSGQGAVTAFIVFLSAASGHGNNVLYHAAVVNRHECGAAAVAGGEMGGRAASGRIYGREDWLRLVVDCVPYHTLLWQRCGDSFLLKDANVYTRSLHPGIQGLLGTTSEIFFHNDSTWLQLLEECHRTRRSICKSLPFALGNGRPPIELHASVSFLHPDSVIVFAEDVTLSKRRAVQQDLEHRRLEALYRLSMMHQRRLRDIFTYVLEQIVELTTSEYGYIYLLNAAESRLGCYAWSANVLKDCRMSHKPRHMLVEATGLWGEAVRKRAPIITNDYDNSPLKSGTPAGHVPLSRHCNVPVVRKGRIVLVVGVANKAEPYTVTDLHLIELLIERAVDIWEERKVQARLRGAKKHAEYANNAKSAFLANMSHEIRTPLNGLLGMLQLLSYGMQDEEQKTYLAMARDSGDSLLGIINDVLDLSRIESGKVVLVTAPCDLREIARRTFAFFVQQLRSKDVVLECTVDETVPETLLLDQERFRQICYNLVGNAVKFTKHGRIRMHVACHAREEKDEATLVLCVSDTGPGIADSVKRRLFSPFVRDDARSRGIQGTGLGLSIVKRLVELMEGDVHCASELGKGTVFTCAIPVANTSPHVEQNKVCEEHPPQYAEPEDEDRQSLRLLLADDDPVNLRLLQEVFRRNGHRVICARNGREVLTQVDQHEFDVLLLDINMPEINGIEALHTIRKGACKACRPDVPVVALTAYAMEGDKERFLAEGMDAYVAKPIDVGEVMRLVKRLSREG